MPSFTLKIRLDETTGCYVPDTRHLYGGTDLFQEMAFNHIAPSGYWPFVYLELFSQLVELHNWTLEITEPIPRIEPTPNEHGNSPTENCSTPDKVVNPS